MNKTCRSIGCENHVELEEDFCKQCTQSTLFEAQDIPAANESMSAKYPKYYKDVGNLTEVDVYAIHHLFNINDPSGCIQHASKKLLLSGVRTGGKSMFKDISEARDTLTRWLQLNQESQ